MGNKAFDMGKFSTFLTKCGVVGEKSIKGEKSFDFDY